MGGGAVEFYTDGGYTTKDMDLALPTDATVDRAFADLGFEKEGRYWCHHTLDLLFEGPAPYGLPGETAPRTRVSVDGLFVTIVGIEDLILDRLRAWVHWGSTEDGRWTTRLVALYRESIDWDYLQQKTAGIAQEAAAIAELYE